MSSVTSTKDTTEPIPDTLSEDDRAVFERLAEKYDGEDVGRIAEAVLQSSEPSEEANS